MSSEPAVECRNVTVGYQRGPVLHDISFSLQSGTITALLGPNGSGKSTLLKTIAKTLTPTAGEIKLMGKECQSLTMKEIAGIAAFVPQDESHPYEFTARQVVLMGRLSRTDGLLDTDEDHHAADEAMEQVDCLHLQNRVVSELSGGERQRVLIARALAQGGQILLLDEPTSHLDFAHQTTLHILLRSLAAEGYCVLLAIHDLNFAAAVSHQSLLLYDGKLAIQAKTIEVLAGSMLEAVYGTTFMRFYTDQGLRLAPILNPRVKISE